MSKTNEMLLDELENCSDENWEVYKKPYSLFTLIILRHQRDSEKGLFDVFLEDIDDRSIDVMVAENVDYEWLERFDSIIVTKPN